jgi:hypothetical protein
MTLNFPAAPADGDIYLNYVYDATEGVWNANPRQLASRFVTSATTPAEPSNGDGWFNTTNGKTYIFYYDGTSGQWIESGYPVLGYQTLENLSDTTIATPTTGQVLKYDGSDWVNGTDSVGKILQVVSAVKSDTSTTSSSTFGDISGLSVSITPSSTNSKILVMASINLGANQANSATYVRLVRDSTDIFIGDTADSRTRTTLDFATAAEAQTSNAITFLDAPATTSSTTYKLQFAAAVNGQLVAVNRRFTDGDSAQRGRTASSITVMEVAG